MELSSNKITSSLLAGAHTLLKIYPCGEAVSVTLIPWWLPTFPFILNYTVAATVTVCDQLVLFR